MQYKKINAFIQYSIRKYKRIHSMQYEKTIYNIFVPF